MEAVRAPGCGLPVFVTEMDDEPRLAATGGALTGLVNAPDDKGERTNALEMSAFFFCGPLEDRVGVRLTSGFDPESLLEDDVQAVVPAKAFSAKDTIPPVRGVTKPRVT